jgi:hypothetical protein
LLRGDRIDLLNLHLGDLWDLLYNVSFDRRKRKSEQKDAKITKGRQRKSPGSEYRLPFGFGGSGQY